MSQEYCPTCKRPFAPELRMTGRERRRLVDIVAARPEGVTRSELAELLYADRIVDAPETLNAISMLVMLANRQLKPQGYRIENSARLRGTKSLIAMMASFFGQPAAQRLRWRCGPPAQARPDKEAHAASLCSIVLLSLPALIAIRRGFIASGISRTRSIFRSPASNEAPFTST
jgi:hypothetical protein